ncbi:hypothetical protein [Burkholderia gladioli]|uniref:hypothetical protein n=1 Tax=Burkholderia gladioli TaxID=28095 RepID=UPI00163DFA7B|nr:hypothetical protein [Burkholderia gladioli]
MRFYTLAEASAAIGSALHPADHVKASEQAARYKKLVYDALCRGALTGRDTDGRLPIDPAFSGAVIAFQVSCVISEADLQSWIDTLGIGIELSPATGLVPAGETVESRRERLLARIATLKAKGVRNFNALTADEEGISVSRLKQLVGTRKAGLETALTTWPPAQKRRQK